MRVISRIPVARGGGGGGAPPLKKKKPRKRGGFFKTGTKKNKNLRGFFKNNF